MENRGRKIKLLPFSVTPWGRVQEWWLKLVSRITCFSLDSLAPPLLPLKRKKKEPTSDQIIIIIIKAETMVSFYGGYYHHLIQNVKVIDSQWSKTTCICETGRLQSDIKQCQDAWYSSLRLAGSSCHMACRLAAPSFCLPCSPCLLVQGPCMTPEGQTAGLLAL